MGGQCIWDEEWFSGRWVVQRASWAPSSEEEPKISLHRYIFTEEGLLGSCPVRPGHSNPGRNGEEVAFDLGDLGLVGTGAVQLYGHRVISGRESPTVQTTGLGQVMGVRAFCVVCARWDPGRRVRMGCVR